MIRRPIVAINGSLTELPHGDTIVGANTDAIESLTWTIATPTVGPHPSYRFPHRAGKIVRVLISVAARGRNGDLIVDLNIHTPASPLTTQRNATTGTTLYTSQSKRPTIHGLNGAETDNAVLEAFLPDITTFTADEFLSLDIDQNDSGASGLAFQLFVNYI